MSTAGTKRAKSKAGGRKKKKKDVNAPKRPRSAYILYCTDMREEVKRQHPEAKPAELMQLMGQMWNNLAGPKKQEYNEKAKEDKQRYNEQMKGYTPPEEESDEDEAPSKKRKTKGKGKKKKDPNEPKRAPSAYLLYGQKVREQVKAEQPDAKSSDIMKTIGAMWQKLSDEDKKPYVEEAANAKAKYEKDKSDYKKSKEDEEDEEEAGGQGGDDDDEDDDAPAAAHDDEDDEDDDDGSD
jgi:hypothetical protein